MEQTKPLFVMLSKTGTRMGRTIRAFTRYGYNHVSLTLDPSFQSWVSFARYVRDIPLAGGFVKETAVRFRSTNGPMPVKIYRIDVPKVMYERLEELFSKAGTGDRRFIYNTYSALGLHLTIPGAYTCLDFANAVLGKKCRSIRELDQVCAPKLVYMGDLKPLLDAAEETDSYLADHSLYQTTRDTLSHFIRLTYRALRPGRYSDPVAEELTMDN